jgi:selenocysteine lyase/cysteine desulfurase
MDITRRELLAGVGGAAAAVTAGSAAAPSLPSATPQTPDDTLPAKRAFAIPAGQTWLNSAFIHPVPVFAADAMRHYLDTRAFREERRSGDELSAQLKAQFAALINARPAEVSFVQNTSTGENLVVNGLGIPGGSGNVVTDALHFEGSLLLYGELARRGLDVRLVPHRDWRVELADLERAVDQRTKLIAISLVSWYNGFQHDLKAVCDLAHAHGAYVYADIVQAAGTTPIDVRASGVDFCACSTFKWLMGDFGLGFLYVKEELLDTVVRRTQYGYQQADMAMHYLPSDAPADQPVTWSLHTDASAHFEVGSYAQSAVNGLLQSVPWLQRLGVADIEAYRQPLLAALHRELPRLGFTAITPPDSRSALVAFVARDAERRFGDRLLRAGISVSLRGDRMRVSPSIFNDGRDIDTLLNTLS